MVIARPKVDILDDSINLLGSAICYKGVRVEYEKVVKNLERETR